jgi:hypothetical protein
MAPTSVSSSVAREMPTDEPRFAGLTKQGKPTSAATRPLTAAGVSSHSRRRNQMYLQSGRPACLKRIFIVTLSIPQLEASTPQPT